MAPSRVALTSPPTVLEMSKEIEMPAGYQLKPRRPGYQCYADDCQQQAVWKGVVAGWFNAGRACDEHKPLLEAVAKDMARDWQPCPCPDACGH